MSACKFYNTRSTAKILAYQRIIRFQAIKNKWKLKDEEGLMYWACESWGSKQYMPNSLNCIDVL